MAKWDETRGCWRLYATVSGRGEKRRRVTRDYKADSGKRGRAEAELVEAQMRVDAIRDLEANLPGSRGEDGTLAREASAWVARHAEWSPKTVKETKYALARYVLPALGSQRLDRITPGDIQRTYSAWAAKGYASSTRRRWHGMVRSIYADAVRLGIVRDNPMIRVKPPSGRTPERRPMAGVDIRRVIDHAASPTAACFFELAVATGARRGTLVALRWREINLDVEPPTVTFAFAASTGENGQVIKGTKADRPYAVQLVGPAVAALRAQRKRALESVLALGLADGFADQFVFSRDAGRTPWSTEYPTHAWLYARRRSGVTSVGTLHDLRHFAATNMLAHGVPFQVVAKRLGCTEANIIKTYSHYVPSVGDTHAAEIMGRLLG